MKKLKSIFFFFLFCSSFFMIFAENPDVLQSLEVSNNAGKSIISGIAPNGPLGYLYQITDILDVSHTLCTKIDEVFIGTKSNYLMKWVFINDKGEVLCEFIMSKELSHASMKPWF